MTDAERVSPRHGWWSVGLAVGSAVLLWPLGFVIAIVLTPFGSMTDPDYQAALRIASFVVLVLCIAMVIAAVVFGVASIVDALRARGRAGRAKAIVLGVVGIVVSLLMSPVLLFLAASQLS